MTHSSDGVGRRMVRGMGRRMGRRLPRSRTLRTAALVLTCVIAAGCGFSPTTPEPTIVPTAAPTATVYRSFPHPPTPPGPTPTPLPAYTFKSLAGSRIFGTAVRLGPLQSDGHYADLIESEFNGVTPEQEMKWNYVERSRGNVDYTDADAIITWASSRHIAVRGFTIAGYQQVPDWVTNGNFDKPTLTQILQDHVTSEVSHFAGKVGVWDVVNEPLLGDAAGTLRPSIWLQTLGPDYIFRVLSWAHAADPAAKLYINESAVEGLGPKSDAFYALVKSLKERGAPLDGVGFEGHLDATTDSQPSGIASNIQRFGALGLKVAFTELDVRMHTPPLEKEPARQRYLYTQIVKTCFTQPACAGITVWEFTDKYSWIPAAYPGLGEAGMFDSNLYGKWDLLPLLFQAMLP